MTRFVVRPCASPLVGSVRIPGDKSIGHRSLLAAALAHGVSEIDGLSGGEDNLRTAAAVGALGAAVEKIGPGAVRVAGAGVDGLRPPRDTIDCGNSGTSIRLLAGLLAGQRFASRLDGDASLRRRPMRRIGEPLAAMGAAIDGAAGPVAGEIYPPLEVRGSALRGIEYRSPVASAQVKSAILLAGLYASGPTAVIEPRRSRDHTERMLADLGVPIEVDGLRVAIDPGVWDRRVPARRVSVPGDPSSAAFLAVAALLVGGAPVTLEACCVNPTRTGFIDALGRMGAELSLEHRDGGGGEPVADLIVESAAPASLGGCRIAGELVVRAIDELPILAVAAARASGVTEIADAAELRVKESDRIATTTAMLRAFGVGVEERADGLIVEGNAGRPLTACTVDAAGDHRIAMAAAVAGLAADGPVVVEDAANVATSFPGFVAALRSLGADIAVE